MASNELRNDDLERDGFCVVPSVFPMNVIDRLTDVVDMTVANEFTRRRAGRVFGIRNVNYQEGYDSKTDRNVGVISCR